MTGTGGEEDRVQVQSDPASPGVPSGPHVALMSVSTARRRTAFRDRVRLSRALRRACAHGHRYVESCRLKV